LFREDRHPEYRENIRIIGFCERYVFPSLHAWRTYCARPFARSMRSAKRSVLAHNERVLANTLCSFDDPARLVDGSLNHGLAWGVEARTY
jgi:hypothetical protein